MGGEILPSAKTSGHNALRGRSQEGCHPIEAISGLRAALDALTPAGGGLQVGSATPQPVSVTGSATAGVATTAAREDHRHAIPEATATQKGIVNLGPGGAAPFDPSGQTIAGVAADLAGHVAERTEAHGGVVGRNNAAAGQVAVFADNQRAGGDANLTWDGAVLNIEGTLDANVARIDDQAGTGERMVVAQADGTQRDVDEVTWENGSSGTETITTTSVQLVQDASAISSTEIQLTPNSLSMAGAAWCTIKFRLDLPWSIALEFRISGGGTPADGMALVVQNQGPAVIGGGGGGKGASGLAPAMVVELDTFLNPEANDPAVPHVALFSNADPNHSLTSHVQTFSQPGMADGTWRALSMSYDGAGTITVSYAGSQIVSAALNPVALVGTEGWIGFTASTGAFSSEHRVRNWSITGKRVVGSGAKLRVAGGLRVTDLSGTGERMVVAQDDGTQRAIGAVVWTGSWLHINGADVAAVGTNGLVARTASGAFAARTITGQSGITMTSGDGVAGAPDVSAAPALSYAFMGF